jgi:hypothetical protein
MSTYISLPCEADVRGWENSKFTGHTKAVPSVCLSADNRFALSGSYDDTLKLWEVATGKCLHTFTGHTRTVLSVHLSADKRFALSGSLGPTIRLWNLDWELEDQLPADWDESARPYLENFLVLHTPYAAILPIDRDPTEEEVALALTRRGTPAWTEEEFQKLLYTLGCAGYGWLRPEGVLRQLAEMKGNQKYLASSYHQKSGLRILKKYLIPILLFFAGFWMALTLAQTGLIIPAFVITFVFLVLSFLLIWRQN